ncbi:MAG: hypothetical protein IJY97_12755 [Clostridia bacterium]|nr:hypothetical protein [Clostridia bacterium]
MTDEIINLLRSQKLKDKIREIGHVFTDTELLYIISMYAPTFDRKLEMLSRFAEIASPEVADAAQKFIEHYKKHRDAFFGNPDGAVYKVKIWKDTVPGDFYEDFDFLASSYEAALKGIDRYYREYEELETSKARYKIIKKHLFTGDESEDDEFPDYLGECWLGAGKVLLDVDDESVTYDFPDDDDSIAPYKAYFQLAVPDIIHNRDIVLYETGIKGMNFGVVLEHAPDDFSSYTYVIPLDSRYLSVRDFANAWRDHEHPYAHSIIQTVTPNELPKEIRENYFAYMKYLDEHPEE